MFEYYAEYRDFTLNVFSVRTNLKLIEAILFRYSNQV